MFKTAIVAILSNNESNQYGTRHFENLVRFEEVYLEEDGENVLSKSGHLEKVSGSTKIASFQAVSVRTQTTLDSVSFDCQSGGSLVGVQELIALAKQMRKVVGVLKRAEIKQGSFTQFDQYVACICGYLNVTHFLQKEYGMPYLSLTEKQFYGELLNYEIKAKNNCLNNDV